MKMIVKSILVGGLLALAACGGRGDDTAGDNVADAAEAQADNLEAMAENATTDAQADALEQKAEAVEETGAAKEEAIDDADIQVNQ